MIRPEFLRGNFTTLRPALIPSAVHGANGSLLRFPMAAVPVMVKAAPYGELGLKPRACGALDGDWL